MDQHHYLKKDLVKLFILGFILMGLIVVVAVWDNSSQILEKIAQSWIK